MGAIQPTHLLHLAWYAEPGKFWQHPVNLAWVRASLDLLEQFHRQGGTRVVMAGTCAEYDWQYGFCSENVTPLVPHTFYGQCKNALQQLVAGAARTLGLSQAWGRVFFPYGPHEYPERLVASVASSLLKGERARCSHGRQLRDFLHVADMAQAFVQLLDSPVEGAVNLGSGQPIAIRELVQTLARLVDREDLLDLGALLPQPQEPPLLVADVRRLTQEVGWTPRFTLEQGLSQTLDWWKHTLTPQP